MSKTRKNFELLSKDCYRPKAVIDCAKPGMENAVACLQRMKNTTGE